MKTVQVRVRIPVSLLPQIEQMQMATGLFYPGEVLLLVFQWFLADAPRPTDKETAHGNPQSVRESGAEHFPDLSHPEDQQKEAESVALALRSNRVSEQAGSLQRCGALSLRDFMRSLAG